MSVMIRSMTEKEFEAFCQMSIAHHVAELMEECAMTQDDAISQAKIEFAGMLPDGLNTKNHFLMTIVENSSKEVVGFIWTIHEYTDGLKQSFVCDFVILDSKRRKGYAVETLHLVEKNALDAGCQESVLFVADGNDAASALYEKCGYQNLRQEQYGKYMLKQLL